MNEDQRRRLKEGIEQLKKNKIQVLNLSSKCLDSLLLRKLISLQDNNIGDEGTKSLSEALQLNSSLQELNLSSKCLNSLPLRNLISLQANKIGDEGKKALDRISSKLQFNQSKSNQVKVERTSNL